MDDPPTRVVPRSVAGRYDVESHLGSGGAGTVWRAHDRLLDRTVAIKFLHAKVDQASLAAVQFRTEAAMAAKLTHPNAVIVYDIGRDADHDYLVMEFVAGGTLAEVFRGGAMEPGLVADLGAQVGRALGAAHQRRMVHRDVKPANVLITTEGVAKVADFGIARALGAANSRLTLPGRVMGTARYLAPEQLRGEPADPRADVYALGVLLHEALTGEIPFGDGTIAEVAARRLVASLPPVSERRSDVPGAVDAAIARATRLEPADRFADGDAFAAELARSSTPEARRTLEVRLTVTPSRSAPSELRMDATADLPVDDFPVAVAVSTSHDEPTAAMAPDASSVGFPSDDRSGTTSPDPDPRPMREPETSDRVGARRGARWPVLVPWLILAVLLGTGTLVAVLEQPGDGSPALERVDRVDDPDREGVRPDVEVITERGQNVDDADGDAVPAGGTNGEADDRDPRAQILDARDHDPFGSGEEHRREVANIFDGDPTTAWQTEGYRGNPELGGLKPGVGIWLDLGEVQEIAEVEVAMIVPGADFTVYAGDGPPEPDADPARWGRPVGEVADADRLTALNFEEPMQGRVWLLWFTSLPPEGPEGFEFRASVSEVRLVRS